MLDDWAGVAAPARGPDDGSHERARVGLAGHVARWRDQICEFEQLRDWELIDADEGRNLAAEVREYFIPDFTGWKDHDAFEDSYAKLKKGLEQVALDNSQGGEEQPGEGS